MSLDVSETCTEPSENETANGHNVHCAWCVHCLKWLRAFHLFAYRLLCIINPQSLLSVLVHLALMGCLCSFLHWASQVQTCLILMSLPIPIKRLSESLLPSLFLSLSFWSFSTPAPNIWWVDKTSSSVSAVNHVQRWQWLCKDGAGKVSSGQYTPAVTDQYNLTEEA